MRIPVAVLLLAVGLAYVACEVAPPEPARLEDQEVVDHALREALAPERKKPSQE